MKVQLAVFAVVMLTGCAGASYNTAEREMKTWAIGQAISKLTCEDVPPEAMKCTVETEGGPISEDLTNLLKPIWDIPAAIARIFVPLF